MNIFIKEPKEYERDLDILGNYNELAARYLAISTGRDVESITKWLEDTLVPVDPDMKAFVRKNAADKHKTYLTMNSYLGNIKADGKLLAPNLVSYLNPKTLESITSKFLVIGMSNRNISKKLAQKLKAEGDSEGAMFNHNNQTYLKILNNTLSGTRSSNHNPLWCPSLHTTLTSVTRCATTYSNAVVEKLFNGNRNYYNVDVTIGDMVSLIRTSDLVAIEKCMEQYGIKAPTHEEALHHILESVQRYTWGDAISESIHDFIFMLNDVELLAITAVEDLKGLVINNDEFLRTFIGKLIDKDLETIDNGEKYISKADADLLSAVGLINKELTTGTTRNILKTKDVASFNKLGASIKHILSTFTEYELFINAFLKTDNMPPAVYNMPNTVRTVVPVSDTDSTIFSTEKWVDWWGSSEDDTSIAAIFAYLDTQILRNVLAQLSKQMGVSDEMLFKLAMKSEFYMPVLAVANQTKHYFSYIKACEGNVYSDNELDRKGVNLKNSRLPTIITDKLQEYIVMVLDTVNESKTLSFLDVLRTPATLAHHIVNSCESGSTEFYMSGQVKVASSYSNDRSPALIQDSLWNNVFAIAYGESDPAPYGNIKIPVKLDKRILLEAWMRTIPVKLQVALREWLLRDVDFIFIDDKLTHKSGVDKEINIGDSILIARPGGPLSGHTGRIYKYKFDSAENMKSFEMNKASIALLPAYGTVRVGFTNFLVPSTVLNDDKIPEIFIPIINTNKMETELLAPFKIVLETLGIYRGDIDNSKPLSKEYSLDLFD